MEKFTNKIMLNILKVIMTVCVLGMLKFRLDLTIAGALVFIIATIVYMALREEGGDNERKERG